MELRERLQQHLGAAYTIERELGGGGMSRVFVAEEVRLGRRVVIKVLSPDLAPGLNAERFEREIRLAASLQHPNIVPLHVTGEVDGIPYFTMPFVEGESLRHRLAHGALPINEVLNILRDVTRALAYAHARGVVHRDIKPDNVLLASGAATVTDFGIAKALAAARGGGGQSSSSGDAKGAPPATLTQLGTSLGTPAYMAPEQVAGDPNVDHRVDLYALGCTTFELLTGKPPYTDRAPQQVLAAHLTEAIPAVGALRTDTPPALADLVTHLMAKNPGDRPQTAAEVLQRLDTVATTSGPTLAFSAPGMLRRALLYYVVATVVVLVCTRAAIIAIGLPDWVFPGAIIVMAFGLPALLVTAYVQHVTRRAATATPTLTPGGTLAPKAPSGTIATMAIKASPHLTWRRTWRGGAIAMSAFVALVAVFMITRAAGIGPWASLAASGKLGTNDRILLADFVTSSNDSALAPIMIEAVRAGLSQSNAVHVVDQSAIADALQEMKRSRDTPLDNRSVIHEVAARTNASGVLSGRIAQLGTGYILSVTLTSTHGDAVLASYQGTANGTGDLLAAIDKLTRKLRSRIGESLKRVQQSIPLERATTASLEALRIYSQAAVANGVDQDYPRAIQLSRQAVALDSTFALAWRKLGIALANTVPRPPQAAIDSALDKAMQYSDRLPELEKYLVQGAYYQTDSRAQDRGKALAAYQSVYAIDSTNAPAANDLGFIYSQRMEFDSAERYDRRVLQLKATRPPINFVSDLAADGHLDAAAALLDSVTRASPRNGANPGVLRTRALVFAAREQWDSMTALSDQLHRLAGGDPARPDGSGIATGVARLRGQFTRALALTNAAAARRTALGPTATPLLAGLPQADLDLVVLGRMAAGIRRLDSIVAGKQWATMDPVDQPYDRVAALYALAGNPRKARAILDRGIANDPSARAPDAQPLIAEVRGEIALAEKNYAEALRQFRTAAVGSDGAPVRSAAAVLDYNVARTFDRSGRPDSAVVYLQRYLAVPRALRYGVDPENLAAVEKRLGELFDARNQRDSALAHYGKFVDHWKNADADVQPMVTTVRKRMVELVAQEGH